MLWQMTLLAFDRCPKQRNSTSVIDHRSHQNDTAASSGRTIEQNGQRRFGQRGQYRASDWQPERFKRDILVLDLAAKACNQTFVLASANGRMAGEFVELDVLG